MYFQNVHAIGDRANGIVLDAFESALTGANVSSLRPRLEHAQIMTESDMARLGELGGKPSSIFCVCCEIPDKNFNDSDCEHTTNSCVSKFSSFVVVILIILRSLKSSPQNQRYVVRGRPVGKIPHSKVFCPNSVHQF